MRTGIAFISLSIAQPIIAQESGQGSQLNEVIAPATIRLAQAAFDNIAAEYPGMSVSVRVGSQEVWSAQHGFEGLSEARATTRDTKFNIYSTAKALTGIGLTKLVARKSLPITTTVGEIAPDLPTRWHAISIIDILSHRSGIRHYNSSLDWLQFAQMNCSAPADALAYFTDAELVSEPGSKAVSYTHLTLPTTSRV